jgi:hypothetical protein
LAENDSALKPKKHGVDNRRSRTSKNKTNVTTAIKVHKFKRLKPEEEFSTQRDRRVSAHFYMFGWGKPLTQRDGDVPG